MGFLLSMDLFLGEKAFGKKEVLNSCLFTYFLKYLKIYHYPFFVFAGVELLGLESLVHRCCNPPQEKDGGDGEVGVVTRYCGSLQGCCAGGQIGCSTWRKLGR